MPDERLLLAVIYRVVLMTVATTNAYLALRQYRVFRDARALRGFVSSLAMLFGALALAAGSDIIRDTLGGDQVFRVLTSIGIAGFLLGLLFSAYTWQLDRAERRRRRATDRS